MLMTDEPSNLARNQKIEEMSFKLEKGRKLKRIRDEFQGIKEIEK